MKLLKKLLIDRKELKKVDFAMLLTAILILLYGTYNIYIATNSSAGIYYPKLQIMWLLVSLFSVYIILLMDYRQVYKIVDIFYWIMIILLIAVLFTDKTKGSRRWFNIGSFKFQPTEFAKLTTMLKISKELNKVDGNLNNVKNFFKVTIYAAIPMVLMLLEPDLGITLLTFSIVLGIYFASGLKIKVILGGFASILGFFVLMLTTNIAPNHWKNRLASFVLSEGTELGIDYQLSRSMISIGSGGIKGSLTPGYFQRIPENYTDFIFAVISENFGLIGGIVLLVLYGFLMIRMLRIASKTEDIFGKSIAVGVFSLFLFSILQNVGMTMGLMPISGITLPLVSYGGSSVLTTFISIAMVINVGMKRKTTLF